MLSCLRDTDPHSAAGGWLSVIAERGLHLACSLLLLNIPVTSGPQYQFLGIAWPNKFTEAPSSRETLQAVIFFTILWSKHSYYSKLAPVCCLLLYHLVFWNTLRSENTSNYLVNILLSEAHKRNVYLFTQTRFPNHVLDWNVNFSTKCKRICTFSSFNIKNSVWCYEIRDGMTFIFWINSINSFS